MEQGPVHLSVTSHPKNLGRIRNAMANVTSEIKLSKQDSGNIILAVDEACSNIIKHCCKDDPFRKIDLTVTYRTDSLIITIVDNGTPFDINLIKPRDVNDIKPGGLGVYIIKQVMDTLEYSHTKEGLNKVKMIKKLII